MEANGNNEYDIRDLKGRPCYAGLDLGATKDMTALVLVFADRDGGFDVIPFCWLPGETLSEREDKTTCPIAYGRRTETYSCSLVARLIQKPWP